MRVLGFWEKHPHIPSICRNCGRTLRTHRRGGGNGYPCTTESEIPD